MGKVYKTAQGKTLDMSALALQHERVRAVGNMKVNARGDVVDANNNVVKSRVKQSNQNYSRGVGQVSHTTPIKADKKPVPPAPKPQPTVEAPPMPNIDPKNPMTGLAAAMARAQQIKDED